MKKMICILMMLMSTLAFAGGKLTLEPTYFVEKKEVRPVVGLSVYQKITNGLGYVSWTGTGYSLDESKKFEQWYSTKHSVEVYYKALTVGVGFQLRSSELKHDLDQSFHVKLGLQLW